MDLILEICCKNVTEKNHLTAWFKQAFHLQMSLVTKNERQGEIKVTKLCWNAGKKQKKISLFVHSRSPDSIAFRTNYHRKEINSLLFHKTCAFPLFPILQNEVKTILYRYKLNSRPTHHIDAVLPINDYKRDVIFVSSFSVFISLPFAPMSCWQLLRYTGELASSACAS